MRLSEKNSITLKEISASISSATGLPEAECRPIALGILEAMSKNLEKGETIEIRGFGSFRVKERKSRWSRNINKGTEVFVPARRSPSFLAGAVLKNRLNPKKIT